MDRSTEDGDDPYATGFECSRRELLTTGAAIGLAGASAGCNQSQNQSGSTTRRSTTRRPTTRAPTPTPSETVGGLVDGDLTVLDSGFVSNRDGLANYFRIRVRNDLQDEAMSLVGITVEFFDGNLRFLEHQNATITHLGPGEVFEGYLSYFNDDAVAYAVRANRTSRAAGFERLGGLSVTDHCIGDERVRGTVANRGSRPVRRLAVRVAFYDGDGDRLATNTDTVTDLAAGSKAPFEVDFDDVLGDGSVAVADYSVAVGDFGDEALTVP